MTLLLTTTLLVSGLCTISCSSVPRQFHVVKEQKNWTEAQQYCREEFTDLATIDNDVEMKKVKSLIQKAGAGSVWIGLRGKWQWSLGDRQFYGENEAEFRNWATGQPDGNEPSCVFKAKSDGKWHDAKCDSRDISGFICYDGKDSTDRYVLVDEKKNWTEAQSYCRKNHKDLASVRNEEEDKKIQKKVEQITSSSNQVWNGAWISLFRGESTWQWSDDSNSSFRYWSSTPHKEPNYDRGAKELCTVMRQDGHWNDLNCNMSKNFICYEDKLVLVRMNKTWNEALQHCQDHYVDLVSVRSERIQRWVTERAKGASTPHVWLGLRHACGVGWFWVWGETVCYDNWAPDQDQVQGCQGVGAVKSGGEGKWVSHVKETEKLNFICATEEE